MSSMIAALVYGLTEVVLRILWAPYYFWNGLRLAWAYTLAYGIQFYPGINSGGLLTTDYGPIGVFAYLAACRVYKIEGFKNRLSKKSTGVS